MRGRSSNQSSMLCLISAESRVPKDHPLRKVKALADVALKRLGPVFEAMYAQQGRPSVPPERVLKGMLLIALYSVRSERQFCEQLDYNLLFRWFLDMDMVQEAFDASTFSRNRQRLLSHEVAAKFFDAVRQQGTDLMSDEHFSVDGTLLEAWASGPQGKRSRSQAQLHGTRFDGDPTRPAGRPARERGQRLLRATRRLEMLRVRLCATVGADRGMKTVGGLRKTRFRGKRRTQMAAHMVGAAYNLLRISKLRAAMP